MKKLILLLALFANVMVATASDNTPEAHGYNYVSIFNDGSAVACHTDGKYYIVNEKYERLSERGYGHIADFARGWSVTSVSDGDKYGFITLGGELFGELDYDMVRKANYKVFECSKGGKYFLAAPNGERVDDAEYDELQYILSKGYFLAKRGGAWLTLNEDGEAISDKTFERLICLKDGTLIAPKGEKKWYEVTSDGRMLDEVDFSQRIGFNKWSLGVLQAVRKCIIMDDDLAVFDDRFDDILEFSDRGLFRFRIGNKMGYIDGRGRELVAPEECIAYEYSDGLVVTYDPKTDRSKVYDIKGNKAFDTHMFTEISRFHDHAAVVRPVDSELYGIINNKGEWICGATYKSIEAVEGSLRKFRATTTDGRTLIINKLGKEQKE